MQTKTDDFTIFPAFIMLLDPAGRRKLWYDLLMRFLFQPFNIVFNVLKVILAWKQAEHAKFDHYHLAKVFIEMLALAGSVAAIIFAMVGTTLFFLAGPVIYTFMLAVRSVFSLGSAIFFYHQSLFIQDPLEKAKMELKVTDAITDAALGAAAVVVLTALLVFATPMVQTVTLLLGFMASIVAAVVLASRFSHLPSVKVAPQHETALMNSARLAGVFGCQYELTETATLEHEANEARSSDNIKTSDCVAACKLNL